MTWTMSRLKYLCVDAGQYGLNVSARDYSSTGHRLIRTSDIDENGRLRSRDKAVYVDVPLESRHEIRVGDLLLSRSGTIGRAMLLSDLDEPSTFAGYLVRFRPQAGIDPRFIAYIAASNGFQAAVEADAVTSTIQNFNAERYANIAVAVPSLDEQRRIADFLDAETTRLDELVRQRTHQRELLSELELSLIDDALEKLGRVPATRLGYLGFVQTGVTVDSGRENDADAVRLPYLRVANVQIGHVVLEDVTEITVPIRIAAASRLKTGDVLMTEGGDLDKLGRGTVWRGEISECLHQNHVFAVRPNLRLLEPDYLALLTRASLARKYFESTGNKTTNLASTSSGKIRDFRVPLPALATQRAMVEEIDGRLRSVAQFEDRLSQQLAILSERRQALIAAAVTGQIDVTTAQGLVPAGGGVG